MLPEQWTLLSRSKTKCMVSRNQDERVTIWFLEDRGKGWRIYKVLFSRENAGCNFRPEQLKRYEGDCRSDCCWDNTQHRNGQRLTEQRFHRVLKSFCEVGHA